MDIASGWTECTALLRRSEADVIGALNAVRPALPFPLLGLDTDNGSEFINYELLRYCKEEEITFTRSRPYRKNDQAHVEEKNGSVVRRLIGYDRYEGVEAWRALTELYSVLRWYQNFFQPSMKLLRKQRHGAQLRKFYDQAKTPCQRALLSKNVSDEQKGSLERLYPTLDPVALLRKIEQLQQRFWQYANVKPGNPVDDSIVNTERQDAADDAHTRPIVVTVAAQTTKTYPRRYRRTKKSRANLADPFVDVWPQLRVQLELNPAQTAKELLQDLQKRRPGQFREGQLRTLQRRVREWRLQLLRRSHAIHRERVIDGELCISDVMLKEFMSDFAGDLEEFQKTREQGSCVTDLAMHLSVSIADCEALDLLRDGKLDAGDEFNDYSWKRMDEIEAEVAKELQALVK